MTLLFQIILITASIILAAIILRKVASSRAKVEDSIFWLGLLLIVLLSIFPDIAGFFASLIGIYSPINFIFLFFIFILIVKQFSSSLRISKLEMRVQELSQALALLKSDSTASSEKAPNGGEEREAVFKRDA